MGWEYQDGNVVYVDDTAGYDWNAGIPQGNEFMVVDPYTGQDINPYNTGSDYQDYYSEGLAGGTDSYDWGSLLGNPAFTGLLGAGVNTLGSYVTSSDAAEAAKQLANVQASAAMQQAEASKFKPVGVTTRFGASNYGYDAQGNLVSAGYKTAPDIASQQNALMDTFGGILRQYKA